MSATHRHGTPRGRRAGRLLVDLLLVVVTLAGLAYLAPSVLGYERYVITGGSMSGTIEKGSVVLENKVPVDDLAVGDVITYLPPADSGVTNLVTHRIVAIGTADDGSRLFRTQGDANPQPDPWRFSLTAETQAVVRHSVPHVGWAVVALADREVRMLLVGGPAVVVALAAAVQLTRAVRGERRGTGSSTPAAAGPPLADDRTPALV